MKNSFFSFGRKAKAILAAAVIVFSFGLMSCQQETDDDNSLSDFLIYNYLSSDERIYGTWTSSYGENFIISGSTFSNAYNGSTTYAGDNVSISWTSATSGYIYFKYTRAAKADWTYSSDSSEAPDVGKWYAVAFKDLQILKSTVSLSGAYKAGGATSTATLEEAKSEFTIENGYFARYSDCTRSN